MLRTVAGGATYDFMVFATAALRSETLFAGVIGRVGIIQP